VSFNGLGYADVLALGQNHLPPDPTGAAGPNHYVQAVNVAFRVFDKNGTALTPPVALSSLFSQLGEPCGSRNDGDPIVLYDQLADRWLISQFCRATNPNNHQVIAISKTSDPTGAYYLYDFHMPNNKFNDYPKFGVWPNAYYMSDNQFLQGGTTFLHAGVFAFDRLKMLAGDATATYIYFDTQELFPPNSPGYSSRGVASLLPDALDGLRPPPTGAPCPFAYFQANEFGDPADQLRIYDFRADFTNPASSSFTERIGSPLAVAAFDPLTGGDTRAIPQPVVSLTLRLDAIPSRLMYRLSYRNLGTAETLIANHTVNASGASFYRAGVRWYELRRTTPTSAFAIREQQSFTVARDGVHRWMGSAANNFRGDVAVAYSVSAVNNIFPGLRYAARLGTDTVGSGLVQGEQTLVAGNGSQTHSSGRWGDYSHLSVDPSDDSSFWFTGEYYGNGSTSGSEWQTRIVKFNPGAAATSPRGSIRGTITNCNNRVAVSGATIRTNTGFWTASSSAGNYAMPSMAPDTVALTVTRPGFATRTTGSIAVIDGGVAIQDICLDPVPVLLAGAPIIANAGPNNALDPGETVTVGLPVQNVGGSTACTTNLVGALQASGGVLNPSFATSYGSLCSGGASVIRYYSFEVDRNLACGSDILLSLKLNDGTTDHGTLTYRVPIGQIQTAASATFDDVTPPNLPSNWSSDASTAVPWTTVNTLPDSGPNCAFAPGQATVGVSHMRRINIPVSSPDCAASVPQPL
jgi:hypothetical protein